MLGWFLYEERCSQPIFFQCSILYHLKTLKMLVIEEKNLMLSVSELTGLTKTALL